MELSVSLDYARKTRPTESPRSLKDALYLCKNAGYRILDYTPSYRTDNYLENARMERQLMEEAGMRVGQSHAPFNRYGTYGTWEDFLPLFHRSFETAVIAGAEYMVVHADEYRVEDRYDPEEITEFAYDYLAPEVEFAKKHGMKVAIENLFEDGSGKAVDGKSRFTSRVEEVIAVIERFGDPDVCCCWDFGHAACSFGHKKMLDSLKPAGKYVECTHVHDNYYGKDLHLVPFLGGVPWESHMQYLKEIGYSGNLSFELGYGGIPGNMMADWMKHTYTVGQYLQKLAE